MSRFFKCGRCGFVQTVSVNCVIGVCVCGWQLCNRFQPVNGSKEVSAQICHNFQAKRTRDLNKNCAKFD